MTDFDDDMEPSASPASGGPWAQYPTAANLYAVANQDGTIAEGDGGGVGVGSDAEDSSGDDTAEVTDPGGMSHPNQYRMGLWRDEGEGQGWTYLEHPAGGVPAEGGGVEPVPYAMKDTPPTFDEGAYAQPTPTHPADEQPVMGSLAESQTGLQQDYEES